MRIAHISDLHFTSTVAKAREVAPRIPSVLLLAAPGLLYTLKRMARGEPVDLGKAAMGVSPALLMAWHALIPILTNWRELSAAREGLLHALQEERPDHVVVTGDMTTLADPSEFRPALDFMDKLEAIVGSGNITLLPGNHDTPFPLTPKGLRSVEMPKKLREYLSVFGAYHQGPWPFPTFRMSKDVSIIGLDSVIPSFPINNVGYVDQGQLDRAGDILHREGAHGTYKIVALHHPTLERARDQRKRLSRESRLIAGILENRDEVMRWAKEQKIDLILCGHHHSMYRIKTPIPMYCAGSTPNIIHTSNNISYRSFQLSGGKLHVHDNQHLLANKEAKKVLAIQKEQADQKPRKGQNKWHRALRTILSVGLERKRGELIAEELEEAESLTKAKVERRYWLPIPWQGEAEEICSEGEPDSQEGE